MAQGLGPSSQEQQVSYSVDWVSGTTYERIWRGSKTALDAIVAAESGYAESLKFTPSSNNRSGTLIGRYITTSSTTTAVTSETQEIDTELIGQHILLHPNFQLLNKDEQHVLRQKFDSKEGTTIPTFNPEVASGRRALAQRAYELMMMGAESCEAPVFTLTRTRTASRRYTGSLDLSSIKEVWTTADLITYSGNGLLYSVPDVTATAEQLAKNMMAGWRQRVCRVTDVADGSRSLVESWVLGVHSLDLYSAH